MLSKITGIAENAGAKVLLDTSGASLEAALKSKVKPELVKPNLTEINGLLGTSFTTDDVDELRSALASDAPWRMLRQIRVSPLMGTKSLLIPLASISGASLEAALKSEVKPELVKPNLTEINGLLGTSFTTDDVDELRAALASDARFSDIPWVVVSMGAAGSVGFHNGRAFRAKTPDIPAVNATGSGDSTIAGFAHAIAAGADDETVLRTANTCGKLNAMDPMTGHLVMDRWDEVYNGVVVTEL